MGHERWPRCFSVKIGKCAIDLIITTMVDLVCGSAGAVFRRDRVVRHGLAVNAIFGFYRRPSYNRSWAVKRRRAARRARYRPSNWSSGLSSSPSIG